MIKWNYALLKTRVNSLIKVKAYNDYMRNYQDQLENEIALKKTYVKRRKGSHFDPDLVRTFLSIREEILSIKNEYEDAEHSCLFSKAKIGKKGISIYSYYK